MSAKILSVFLMTFVITVISGCSSKIEYVDRPVDVPIVQKCVVSVPVSCQSGKPTYTEELNQMRICIRDFKEVINVCR